MICMWLQRKCRLPIVAPRRNSQLVMGCVWGPSRGGVFVRGCFLSHVLLPSVSAALPDESNGVEVAGRVSRVRSMSHARNVDRCMVARPCGRGLGWETLAVFSLTVVLIRASLERRLHSLERGDVRSSFRPPIRANTIPMEEAALFAARANPSREEPLLQRIPFKLVR